MSGWGSAGAWYVQRFVDEELYFRASGERLKNGNSAGLLVTRQLDRPRARPRAKRISVPPHAQPLWTPCDSVPAAVSDAERARG